jgi:predicted hotdog family 3-hydroxylacyl-ACP dehydratase
MKIDLNLPPIATLLPHGGAMVLLDRLVSIDDDSVCAEVTIRAASVFYDQVAGGVGAWIGIEYMAQTIAAHAGHAALKRGEAAGIGFLLGARRYQAQQPLFALGSVLRVHARRALQGDNGLMTFDCRIDIVDIVDIVENNVFRTAATATVAVFQPPDAAVFFQDNAGAGLTMNGSGNASATE